MKQVSEKAERNKGPIADVLDALLPDKGLILEVASKSGQHVAYFARRFPHLMWQPSDPDPEARSSIMAHLEHSGLSNVRAPLDLDVARGPWPIKRADGVVCINLHETKNGLTALLEKAASILADGCRLFLYGPYPKNEMEPLLGRTFKLVKAAEMPDTHYTLILERNGSSGQSGSTPRK